MRTIPAWLLVGASMLPAVAEGNLGGALPVERLAAASQAAIVGALQGTRAAEPIVSGDAWIGLAGAPLLENDDDMVKFVAFPEAFA